MRESLRKVFEMASSSSVISSGITSNQSQTITNNLVSNNSQNNNIINGLNDDKNFLINLENSKWLEHIRLVLNGALKIVRYISQHRASVLVHCSDGWDRTAQVNYFKKLLVINHLDFYHTQSLLKLSSRISLRSILLLY